MVIGKCQSLTSFTDRASADIQTNLVVDCIKRLHDYGITVHAVTCDWTEVNLSMFRNLGVEMDESYFSHPCNSIIKVFEICDVGHMLKLVRNTLGDLRIIYDNKNKPIRWAHSACLITTIFSNLTIK